MKRLATLLLVGVLASPAPAPAEPAAPYAKRPEVRAFVRALVERHGFVERELLYLFSRLRRVDAVLKAIEPGAQPRSWQAYRATFVNDRRIRGGLEFWSANRDALARARRDYGVPEEYLVAIAGVETFYGRATGRWRVVDALATLAFDYPPRAGYFRSELENYLIYAREAGIDVFSVRGSYAGAIGIPQFMPGSTLRYAVDFDGDGVVDLRRNAADAIGSIANFLKQHGWKAGEPVLLEARLNGEGWRAYADGSVEPSHSLAELARAGVQALQAPERAQEKRAALVELESPQRSSEVRLGLNNFYVLTRYNRSAFYAAAVHDLAQELRGRR